MQNVEANPASRVGGKSYIIKGIGWYSEWPIFENEWFVLVEDIKYKSRKTLKRVSLKKAPRKPLSLPKRDMKKTLRKLGGFK